MTPEELAAKVGIGKPAARQRLKTRDAEDLLLPPRCQTIKHPWRGRASCTSQKAMLSHMRHAAGRSVTHNTALSRPRDKAEKNR